MFEGFPAHPSLDDSEAFDAYSFTHLCEVGFCGCLVSAAAGFSEGFFSSEVFDVVFDVWDQFELSSHEGSEAPPSGCYWTGLPGPVWWRFFQRIGLIGVKFMFSNKILGEPFSFIFLKMLGPISQMNTELFNQPARDKFDFEA